MTTARFTLEELLTATGGCLIGDSRSFERARVSTDSRTFQSGEFFLPLVGENFDGHNYLDAVFEEGAVGAFVQKDWLVQKPYWQKLPNLISVKDTTEAYLAVARCHRRRMKAKIVAITGSSGKTTTKEMLFQTFSRVLKTQCTSRNFNNEIGVSQTLLSLQPETEVMIVEMGMRGLGEISLLSRYAEPDIALVINVGPAHIGRLGSLENIAQAKCEIFSGLDPKTGIALVNADNPLLLKTARKVWFGRLETYSLGEVQGEVPSESGGVCFEYAGHTIELSLPGEHMISNALAVLKAGEILGLSLDQLAQGLSSFQPAEGRWRRKPLVGFENVWIIDDAYNANPASMKASLSAFLAQDSGGLKRYLLIGGMKELGTEEKRYHQELGDWLAGCSGIDALFTIGEEGRWISDSARSQLACPVIHVGDTDDHVLNARSLIESLQQYNVPLQDVLLFLKGSRAYRLEKLVAALQPFSPHPS